jgi:long-chain fatty acid transport protein
VAVSPAVSFEADYQWTRWSVFDTLPVNFAVAPSRAVVESYQNTHGIRIGGTVALSDKVTFRGGWDHHGGAAPQQTVTPLLPEGQRNEFTGGLGWKPSAQWNVAISYQYIRQDDTRGRVSEPPAGVDPFSLNSGLYHLYAHLISATITLHLMPGGEQ